VLGKSNGIVPQQPSFRTFEATIRSSSVGSLAEVCARRVRQGRLLEQQARLPQSKMLRSSCSFPDSEQRPLRFRRRERARATDV
jgi:hypothetical protein